MLRFAVYKQPHHTPFVRNATSREATRFMREHGISNTDCKEAVRFCIQNKGVLYSRHGVEAHLED